ncbi:MAG: hypothetical protein HOP31_01905 [Ignavibacteria bacterium]|nr:hypothetical protein [Ignavibacteria bacterium]
MYKYLLIILVLVPPLFSKSIPEKFFDALIYNKPEITDYVNNDELAKSQRLGVTYTGVKNKFMLGYELPEEIQAGIINGKYKYEIKELTAENGFTKVTFQVKDANFSKVYYFRDGFVTNSTYYSTKWSGKESKYFAFSIEEPKYFNDYCIKRLDDFVDMIADTLGFTISERRILEKEKMGYIFCKDEESIEKITGFRAKGMAMLGSDEIVTSYQTHFHEVAHLLINYKLKNLGLYTLPFFMEGFAVAVGGRGGMAPRVITDLGYFLQKSEQLTYDSILTFDQFRSIDGSMTYPVSGLYNSFLLNELGGEKYLELYKKVNGNFEFIKNFNLNSLSLSADTKWTTFLDDYDGHPEIFCDVSDTNRSRNGIASIGLLPITVNEYLKFFINDYIFFGYDKLNDKDKNYFSRLFISMFPKDSTNADYPDEYGIFVDSNSIKVINFFNDEIVANYSSGFTVDKKQVPNKNNDFEFFVKKSILNKFNSEEVYYAGVHLKTYFDIYKEHMKK